MKDIRIRLLSVLLLLIVLYVLSGIAFGTAITDNTSMNEIKSTATNERFLNFTVTGALVTAIINIITTVFTVKNSQKTEAMKRGYDFLFKTLDELKKKREEIHEISKHESINTIGAFAGKIDEMTSEDLSKVHKEWNESHDKISSIYRSIDFYFIKSERDELDRILNNYTELTDSVLAMVIKKVKVDKDGIRDLASKKRDIQIEFYGKFTVAIDNELKRVADIVNKYYLG